MTKYKKATVNIDDKCNANYMGSYIMEYVPFANLMIITAKIAGNEIMFIRQGDDGLWDLLKNNDKPVSVGRMIYMGFEAKHI